jgi:hypothetical protein
MKILKIIVLFASIMFSIISNATDKNLIHIKGCNDQVLAKVIDDLNIRKILIDYHPGACKEIPNSSYLTIVALLSSEDPVDFKNLDLVIVKTDTGEIINKLHTPYFYSTGPHSNIAGDLAIDTAKYQLAKGIRAFGITYTDDHTFSGYQKVIHLFYAKEKEIVPVLGGGGENGQEGLSIESAWNTRTDGECEDPILPSESTQSVLSMLPSVTDGFFDILVTEKNSEYKRDKCDFKELPTKTRKYILKYNNKTGLYSENQPNQN